MRSLPISSIVVFVASLATGTAAWATCPPDCPTAPRYGIESLYTFDDGNVHRSQTGYVVEEIPIDKLLYGGSGSFQVGVTTPWHSGDPDHTKIGLLLGISLLPLDDFTPATFQVRFPPRPPSRVFNPDPPFSTPPEYRFYIPRPKKYKWLPDPVLGIDQERHFYGGLSVGFVVGSNENGNPDQGPDPIYNRMIVHYKFGQRADFGVIPEPTIWMMTIAGFGVTGIVLRRRRRPGAGVVQDG